ncbi:MAG: adenosylcobinamide-GDP ribazoletransferase [Acidimicrobiales bacterium]
MREALGFLTSLGGPRQPTQEALAWFGPVGALLGLALGGLWWGAAQLWPRPVAAAVVVAADLALTGLLHLDGLVDAADGLLPHLSTERRLAVMREPDAGAFGVGVAVVVLLVRWSTLAALRPAPLLLAALWCLSRAAMAVTAARLRYARADGGIVSSFRPAASDPGTTRRAASAWCLFVAMLCGSVALAAGWSLPAGPVAVLAGTIAFGAVVWLALRRIGGFTGDVLGAAGLFAESVGLLAAAARW